MVVQSLVKIVDKVHIVTANDRTDNKEGSSTTKTLICSISLRSLIFTTVWPHCSFYTPCMTNSPSSPLTSASTSFSKQGNVSHIRIVFDYDKIIRDDFGSIVQIFMLSQDSLMSAMVAEKALWQLNLNLVPCLLYKHAKCQIVYPQKSNIKRVDC